MNSIAVIRARLPYVDRRALSEAWFSALHLACGPITNARRSQGQISQNSFPSRVEILASGRLMAVRGGATLPTRAPAPSAGRRPERQSSFEAARVPRMERVRRPGGGNVRAAEAWRSQETRANFGIDLPGGGRVQILLRRDGRTLLVLALCSTRHVEFVRRALAGADLHLRLRGERVSSSVRAL